MQTTVEGGERLSPHFTLHEFADWHTHRLPPAKSRPALKRLCRNVLEPLRARFGTCHVHSGFRSLQTNRDVGGAPDSRHLYSRHWDSPAADITFARGTVQEWATAADRLGVGGLGVYTTHIHVDQRSGRARW